ncbi:hypothetical protein CPter291_1627 [Collimonas pratensis]|uniref:Uncharacterized protein n=1 Tax=Collimonas pratensis TaxID=279113 RepID=A0ABM5Z491_9BURK|nr:hypothetical protein CPter291_1627 [Collimonas pratensis]
MLSAAGIQRFAHAFIAGRVGTCAHAAPNGMPPGESSRVGTMCPPYAQARNTVRNAIIRP